MAGPQRDLVTIVVVVGECVDHLLRLGSELQPVLGRGALRDPVIPVPHRHVLHHDVPRVLHRLGTRRVVHPQGNAGGILRLPVTNVVQVRSEYCKPVVIVLQVILEGLQGRLQPSQVASVPRPPPAFLEQLLQSRLATKLVQGLVIKFVDLAADQRQSEGFGLDAPDVGEREHVLFIGVVSEVWHCVDYVAEQFPAFFHLVAVAFVVHHDVVAAAALRGHAGDCPNDVPEHRALVLVSPHHWRADHDVPEALRHVGAVVVGMFVG
mmetsp:Transcript_38162/g.106259  ORF Transcript_38162/g.106259 Transcript_38162/m.106259 type:complete len:265 (+) Transcript_38162:2017-2811(+)